MNKKISYFKLSFIALLSVAFISALSSCDGSSDSDSWESVLDGIFVSAKFKTDSESDASGTVMEQDTYNGDGTGISNVLGSLGIILTDYPFTYFFSSVQRFVREMVLPTGVTLAETGLLSRDKSTFVMIDNDPTDPIQIDIGLGFGFKKASSTPTLTGSYEAMLIHNSSGTTNFGVSTHSYEFSADGTGTSTGASGGTAAIRYSVAADGALEIFASIAGHEEMVAGYISQDGSYFFAVDLNRDDEFVGLQVGFKKSTGKSTASLNGTYHTAHMRNVIASDPATNQTTVVFDGAGNATFNTARQHTATYSVADDGTLILLFGEAREERKGIVSPDGNLVMTVDLNVDDPDDEIISFNFYVKDME